MTIFEGWTFFTDGGSHSADGETPAGWGAVARSPNGRQFVMFGPVVTTEAHLAFDGARIHTNNTAELSSIIEARSFLAPAGPVSRCSQACFFYDSKHVWEHGTDTHERSIGLDQSATVGPTPVEAAYHHAAYLQSWAKRRE